MADNKMDTYMAAAKRYGMQDVIELAESQRKVMENAPFTVGLVGNNFKIIPLLAALTEIAELGGISARRSFVMEVMEGEETACFQPDRQDAGKMMFQEMKDAMEESGSLDSEEEPSVFYVRLTAANWKMKGVRLLVIGSAADFRDIPWQEVSLLMDECCMVLSATHLMSMEERSLIRKGEVPVNTYILTDMLQIPEEEGRNDVMRQLISFIGGNGENVVRDDDRERMQGLCAIWKKKSHDADVIAKMRLETLEKVVCKRLECNLESIKQDYKSDGKKIQDMTNHLAKAYGELPSYKERTARHIRMYYLEEIKSELESELIRFHAKLRQDLKTGIDEENDIKQLQNTLPGYILGEWEGFLSETLKSRLEDTALRIDLAIENYIGQNVEELLRQFLSGEEYSDLKNLIEMQFGENSILPQGGNMEMPCNRVLFDSSGNHGFSGLLPKCVMAAGGVALLCSAFLPGALMVFMGYQMNSGAKEAAKEKLLQEGREMSDQCLKEVQKKMQEAFADMEKDAAKLTADCYDTVMNRLVSILEGFKDDDVGIQKKMAQIEAEMQELRKKTADRKVISNEK